MKAISIKAVVVGVLADILLTLFFMALVIILISLVLYGEGTQGDALVQSTREIMHSTPFLSGIMVVGSIMDFVAGLITGKLAKSSEVTHAGLTGAISLVIGLAIPSATPSTFPNWFHWTGILLTIPMFLLGGIASIKFRNSDFLNISLKNKFLVLKGIIILCIYEGIMLIGWAVITNKDIIFSIMEALLWLAIAVGLIIKQNLARKAMIVWLVLEIVLNAPYRLFHFNKQYLAASTSLIFYISSRFFVIYYLRRKSIIERFQRHGRNVMSEMG